MKRNILTISMRRFCYRKPQKDLSLEDAAQDWTLDLFSKQIPTALHHTFTSYLDLSHSDIGGHLE